ncbi:MAG: carbohydrate ABC transporter permease [Candidatus Atribacteria bacterium]|nr:carbohydrate ABC transporter permease [Candidatus Atribacteria bacterium]
MHGQFHRSTPGIIKLILYLFMIIVTVFTLAPTAWMISTSLKPKWEVFESVVRWIPKTFTLDNYIRSFQLLPLFNWLSNSAVVAVFTLLLTLFCDILVAYAFGKMEFRGKSFLFTLVLITVMVPIYSTAVPMYKLTRWMGFMDTKTGIILPQAAEAIGVFLLTQFFRSIPRELSEAAKIDGASQWTIVWRVVVPLSVPAITVLTILTLANSWNNFFWPLVIAQSNASITLPVGLSSVMSGVSEGAEAREYGLIMATSIIACLPIVVAFLFLQRRFIEGISMTGIKG